MPFFSTRAMGLVLHARPTLITVVLAVVWASPAGASTLFGAKASASGNWGCGGSNVQVVTDPISASASANFSGYYGEIVGCADPTNPNYGATEFAEGMSAANLATGLLQASGIAGNAVSGIPIGGGGSATAQFTDTLDIIPIGAGVLVPGTAMLTLTLDDSAVGVSPLAVGNLAYIQGMIAAVQDGINLTPVVGTCTVGGDGPNLPPPPDEEQCQFALQMGLPIDASDSVFSFTMILNVDAANGYADAFNTAQAGVVLPQGDTFTSASGVFLTQEGESTPEPASVVLFGLGMTALLRIKKRKDAAGAAARGRARARCD